MAEVPWCPLGSLPLLWVERKEEVGYSLQRASTCKEEGKRGSHQHKDWRTVDKLHLQPLPDCPKHGLLSKAVERLNSRIWRSECHSD